MCIRDRLKIGITTVKTFDDLNDDKYKQPGNFVYVRDDNLSLIHIYKMFLLKCVL